MSHKTPIRYAGGKSKAYNQIISHLPYLPYPKRIISPFIGGGSMECRWAGELGIEVIGYDIFDALVNFWNVLSETPNELADILETLEPTKEKYAEIKEILMQWEQTQTMLKDWKTSHYKREPIQLDDVTAAAYYFYNHNLSYGPMYLGWISNVYQDKTKWKKMIDNIRNFSNPNFQVKRGSFEEVIPRYKDDFLYLDPPYFLEKDADNKMFKGIYPNANIDVHHTGFDHELLANLLKEHSGGFALSYNNCETIREYYSDFEFHYPEWHYSYALGETRIGKNKEEVGNEPKKSHEILVIG